jgi:outer membrane protein
VKNPLNSICIALLLCTSAANAQQTPTSTTAPAPTAGGRKLTIQEAESLALKNNPQITVGKLRALVAKQIVRETRSALMPTATLSLTAVDSRAGSRIAAGFLNNPVIYPRAAAGLAASQLITDFGRTTNLVGSSELSAKAEDENAAATRAQILLLVDQNFYGVLQAKAVLQVAQGTVQSRGAIVDKIQALAQSKLKSDLDLSFVKVDLARARLLQLEAQNNYETSRAGLSALLGFSDEQDFEPVEDAATMDPPAGDVAPLIQLAMQQRPEVAALQYDVDSAAKYGRAEHDLVRPTISALAAVGIAPVRDDHIDNWYGAAGVNINIPIFNGFLFNARAKAADFETEIQRQKLTDLRNNIARDVRNSWQQNLQDYQRLEVTRQFREQADQALDLAQTRYNLGLGSIVEYTQAELQQTEAQIADADARYRYRLSELELAYTTGTRP